MDRYVLEIDEEMQFVVTIGGASTGGSDDRPVGILVTALTGTTGLTGIIETQETEES